MEEATKWIGRQEINPGKRKLRRRAIAAQVYTNEGAEMLNYRKGTRTTGLAAGKKGWPHGSWGHWTGVLLI